jgi:hypothetical protein
MRCAFDSVAEHLVATHGEVSTYPGYEPSLFARLVLRRRAVPGESWPTANPLASEAALQEFEESRGVTLPRDVRDCYQRMNGSEEYTDIDQGWIRFWPIERWRLVVDEFPDEQALDFPRLKAAYVFADHSYSAYFYALELESDSAGSVLNAQNGAEIAPSFSAFVGAALSSQIPPYSEYGEVEVQD